MCWLWLCRQVGTVEERERAKLLVRIMCHMNTWRDKTADPGKLLSCSSIMPGELENKSVGREAAMHDSSQMCHPPSLLVCMCVSG